MYLLTEIGLAHQFVGQDWFNFLLLEGIIFFIRVPKHYDYIVNGVKLKAENLLFNRQSCKIDDIEVLGIKGLSVAMHKVKNKQEEQDYLIVLTNGYAYEALRNYKKRWSIEVMFQDFKEQGFNLEKTHLKEDDKLKKLLYLVSIAYAFFLYSCRAVDRENQGEVSVKKSWLSCKKHI